MKNYVEVQDKFSLATDLIHESGDEEKSMQVSCEEVGNAARWNDLPAAACRIMQKLFTVQD